jgi:hypothetical protein
MAKNSSLTISEEDKGWLAAVGLMAVYWADFENMMDGYLQAIAIFPLEMGRKDHRVHEYDIQQANPILEG